MSNLWLNLAWKEWHEHKWKTAALTAILPVFVLLMGGDDVAIDLGMGAMLVGAVGALFFAIGVAAGERADGSLNFVRGLPVDLRKVAIVRLGTSAALCIAPIVVTAIIAQGMASVGAARASPSDLWQITLIECVACLSLFFWITAAAIDQPSQLRVAVIGVFVVLAWLGIGKFLDSEEIRRRWPSGLVQAALNVGPAGCWRLGMIPFEGPRSWTSLIGWEAFAMSALFAVSVMRYGHELMPAWVRADRSLQTGGPRLRRPFRSPRRAMAWLQVTEAMPVCVAGSILLIGWSGVVAVLHGREGFLVDSAMELLIISTIWIGFLWVGVVGASTFVPNLQSGLATFWRSRPIDPGRWFWSKFWLGAFVSLAAIHVPAVTAIGLSQKLAWLGSSRASALVGYLCVPLTHLMVYSIAVLVACWIRHVVYAGIFGLCISAAIVLLPGKPNGMGGILELIRIDIAIQRLSAFADAGFTVSEPHDLGFLPYVLFTLVVIGASSWTAAWAVKRDFAMYR